MMINRFIQSFLGALTANIAVGLVLLFSVKKKLDNSMLGSFI